MTARRWRLISSLAAYRAARTGPEVAAEPAARQTRYMALGDSLAAGYGAIPATAGYVYRLYLSEVVGAVRDVLFSNAGVPGATSAQVLRHQVPLAVEAFRPDVVTVTVGGNDLLRVLSGADPGVVLAEFRANFTELLARLRSGLPGARVVASNLYKVPEIAGSESLVPMFNALVARIAQEYGIAVADIYSAFCGRSGLLATVHRGGGEFEVHPSNAGHQAIADAFTAVMH